MLEQNLIEKMNWRYAVKKFDSTKKINRETWQTLEESLLLTPSSFGMQPWRFLVIQDPNLRKKLTPISWQQSQVEDCSHYIVFLAKESISEEDIHHYLLRISEVRKIPVEELSQMKQLLVGDIIHGPRQQWIKEWTARQTYVALGNLMTTAALLGVDTCPMEGLEPAKYDEVLNLKGSGYRTLCGLALGYRSEEDGYARMKKVRFPKEEMIRYL